MRLDWYDYGARWMDGVGGRWSSMDPLCEKYYDVSPYVYCAGDPVNRVDVDGKSTWVINQGNGKYKVVGGNLNDNDKNIYVGAINEDGAFIPQKSIGVTTSLTSFYDSDAEGGGRWSIGSVIDTKDKSGNNFLTMIISNNPPLFDDYIINARKNHPYDFKVTNGTGKKYGNEKFYRGMPIGVTGNGQVIFTSARDVGNIAAGYVAAENGMSWKASRIAFDLYQVGVEGCSSRNAQYYGWKMGYNNTTNHQKADNLMSSFGSLFHTISNYIFNKIIK